MEQAPGTLLEDKPAGVVLHTRLAADDVAEDAVAAARSVLQDRKGVFLKNGNRVLETSVVNASKGEGLTFLRQITGATAVVLSPETTSPTRTPWAASSPGDVGVKGGPGLHPGRVPGGVAGPRRGTAGGPAAGAEPGGGRGRPGAD